MLSMKFSSWLVAVENKLKSDLGDDVIEDAYSKYLNGWTIDEYATEIDNQLEEESQKRKAMNAFAKHFFENEYEERLALLETEHVKCWN